MSTPTDTTPSGLESPLEGPPPEDQLVRTALTALVASHGLPEPRLVSGRFGTAVLAAAGPRPLDEWLEWAGQMSREPYCWTVRRPPTSSEAACDVYAAGVVAGLPVTISAPSRELLPPRPAVADVVAAAHLAHPG